MRRRAMWPVQVDRGDGITRLLNPRQVTGHSIGPLLPTFPGQSYVYEQIYHGSEHQDAASPKHSTDTKAVG